MVNRRDTRQAGWTEKGERRDGMMRETEKGKEDGRGGQTKERERTNYAGRH